MKNKNIATDEVVDHYTAKLMAACMRLDNALDQSEVKLSQILHIQNVLNQMNTALMKHVPTAK